MHSHPTYVDGGWSVSLHDVQLMTNSLPERIWNKNIPTISGKKMLHSIALLLNEILIPKSYLNLFS